MKRTVEVREERKRRGNGGKGLERMGFCEGGCDGFVGHVFSGCQGGSSLYRGGGQDLAQTRRRMGKNWA